MTDSAKELLLKIVSSYRENGTNNFNYLFYRDYGYRVIDELAAMRCVAKMNDYASTVKLTYIGYDIAMEIQK